MYVGRDYDPQQPEEAELFGMDFADQLAVGETILTATVTLVTLAGTDPSPDDHVIGAATITGSKVSQKIGGLLIYCKYAVEFTITTSQGQTIILFSRVTCVGVN